MWKPLLLCWLVLSWGCGGAGGGRDVTPRATPAAVPAASVSLERHVGGFGVGPVYRLTIDGDGEVTFEGGKNTKVRGVVKSKLSRDEAQRVLSEFKKLDYFSLADKYVHGENCPEYVTDMPLVVTTFTSEGRSKTVRHNTGCTGTPTLGRLTALEDMIDEAAGTRRWIE